MIRRSFFATAISAIVGLVSPKPGWKIWRDGHLVRMKDLRKGDLFQIEASPGAECTAASDPYWSWEDSCWGIEADIDYSKEGEGDIIGEVP